MNDAFIQELIATVTRREETAREQFGNLTADQLNQTPEPGRWSIGECLMHLITANEPYLPIFESIRTGTKPSNIWERVPVLPALWGAMVLNAVDPKTARKSKAPKVFAPPPEPVGPDVVDRFCDQQRGLKDAIKPLASVDLDRTIITSPVARPITYSLRHALLIVVRHEERHMNQAMGVLDTLQTTKV